MPERDPSVGEWRARAAALTDELRAVIEALSVCEPTAEELVAATELARALRRQLRGPRRVRWYEADESAAPSGTPSRASSFDQNPIRGRLNPVAPPLSVEVVESADGRRAVRGRTRLGMAYEGPPHGVHGGWVAALFDDLLGSAKALTGAPGMTATLTVRFRQITPVEEELQLDGWIERESGRRVVAKATCHAGEALTAEAEALFVGVDFDEVREREEQRRGR